MMKIRAVAILASLSALLVTSTVVHADKKKHEEKYCSALSALSTDLAKLDAIGPNSTVKELRTVVVQIDKDSKTIEKETRKIRTPTSQQFTQSANQLYQEAHSIPDNMTIEQARSRIEGDVQNVKRNAQAMANESGCPQAMPQTQTP